MDTVVLIVSIIVSIAAGVVATWNLIDTRKKSRPYKKKKKKV